MGNLGNIIIIQCVYLILVCLHSAVYRLLNFVCLRTYCILQNVIIQSRDFEKITINVQL